MKWDKYLSLAVGTLGSITSYLWGGLDLALKTLIILMIIDYLTGVMCAVKNKELSSKVGFRGLTKKVVILAVVAVGVSVDNVTGANGLVRAAVIYFYASMEGISILENAARYGIAIPKKLEDALIQLQEGNDKEIKGDDFHG